MTLKRRGSGTAPPRLAALLSERDRAVLASLGRLRLLGVRQVERLHFHEGSPLTQARRCRSTLARLHQLNLVHRMERRLGGVHAGSSGFIYCLSSVGQRTMGSPGPAGGVRRRRPWEPSALFQDHMLAVSELYVRLVEAERGGEIKLGAFQAEPACWRRFVGAGGQTLMLKPDAFTTVVAGDTEHLSFVEVDLGSEGPTTLRRKLDAYLAYARSGREQLRHGTFPRVVFLTPDDERARRVAQAIAPTLNKAPELGAIGLLDSAVELLNGGQL